MTLKKLLFVDDRTQRIHAALEKYSQEYKVTIATNVKDALRALAYEDFQVVSLDHDLSGCDFEDPDSPTCGMEIVRYIEKSGWPEWKPRPSFIVHSSNPFAAGLMYSWLEGMEFSVTHRPFGWKEYQHGVVAGAFDLIHPGYARLLKQARESCHRVTVLLHDKPDQVLDIDSRKEIVLALKYVDDVMVYRTEEELTELLLKIKPDVRIEGDDHMSTTRPDLPFPTVYHTRDHDWSATRLKRMVAEKVMGVAV